MFAPVAGTVVEVNEELEDAPEMLNEKPYDAWICKIKMENADDVNELMSAADYEKFLQEEA